jgi:hypothetical protein
VSPTWPYFQLKREHGECEHPRSHLLYIYSNTGNTYPLTSHPRQSSPTQGSASPAPNVPMHLRALSDNYNHACESPYRIFHVLLWNLSILVRGTRCSISFKGYISSPLSSKNFSMRGTGHRPVRSCSLGFVSNKFEFNHRVFDIIE